VTRLLVAHQYNNRLFTAIHVGSHWKIQDRRQITNRQHTN